MHPYLFKIGNFELRIYSLMLMLAVLIAIYFISKRAKSLKMDSRVIENLVIVAFLGGIVGARLYYVVFNWSYFKMYPMQIPAVWHGGLAIHGGIIMGIITVYFYCKKYNLSFFTIGDLVAPFILLGQGIGRIGNFANGEAHGFPTITPPGIIFKIKPIFTDFWKSTLSQEGIVNSPAGITTLYHKVLTNPVVVNFEGKEYLLKEYVPWGISFPPTFMSQAYREFGTMPVHPTFFYEMILNFIGAALLIYLWKKNKNIGSGKIFAIYIAMYGLIRGFVTFFRADDLMIGSYRAPHVISILLIIAAVVWYKLASKSKAASLKKNAS